jgi:catechol 2,3-dioxygenase-like lactoylglutathione lyase family enzyme
MVIRPEGVHHIGISVSDVRRSVRFWSELLDTEPRWEKVLDGAYLGGVTGYPGVVLDAAVIDLPGGVALEILEYRGVEKTLNPDATANPGNVHICLQTSDIEGLRDRALASGARPVSPEVTTVSEGPNTGARACYLRDPDGITVELFQPAPQ